ncbi:MAG: hypothetical protein HQL20_04230 [Candidatus Omnitrophica bacterium]|nr:hypothetical protein [Candidatus Omnitrophota bacterium]
MRKVFGVSVMVVGFLTVAGSTLLHAQAPVDAAAPAAVTAPVAVNEPAAGAPAAAMEEDKFSFGKVISVVDGVVTVKEYDFTKDADVETVYTVTAETELGNVNAVADLKAGDDIVIDYLEKDGKRVVTTLVKEEKSTEVMNGEGDAAANATAPAVNDAVPAPEAVMNEAAPVQP